MMSKWPSELLGGFAFLLIAAYTAYLAHVAIRRPDVIERWRKRNPPWARPFMPRRTDSPLGWLSGLAVGIVSLACFAVSLLLLILGLRKILGL